MCTEMTTFARTDAGSYRGRERSNEVVTSSTIGFLPSWTLLSVQNLPYRFLCISSLRLSVLDLGDLATQVVSVSEIVCPFLDCAWMLLFGVMTDLVECW